jgi:hypothetical protein
MKLLRSTLLLLFIFLFSTNNFAQSIIRTTLDPGQLPPPPSNWSKKNKLGFDISEIAFVNWSAGEQVQFQVFLKVNLPEHIPKKIINGLMNLL